MKQRKSPATKCLELLSLINSHEKASKWDLIKLLGTEEAFRKWIDKFLEAHKIVTKIEEGRITYYQKTQKGEIFHKTLKDHDIFMVWKGISGKKLRSIF
jgi:phage anti-repressor protein